MIVNSFRAFLGVLLLSLLVTGVRAEDKPADPTAPVAPAITAPAAGTAPAAAPAAAATKLVIVKAVYGDLPDGMKADVTEKVKTFVKEDALSVVASNDNFGDPVEGTVKKLRVEYTFNGEKKSKDAAENETLTISNKGE